MCCFSHPVMFPSLKPRFKQALGSRRSPAVREAARPSPVPAGAAVHGQQLGGQLSSSTRAQLTRKPQATFLQVITWIPFSQFTLYWEAGNMFSSIIPKIQGSLQLAKWSSLSASFSFQFLCKLCCTYDDIKLK